jgi:hypothetical protein
MGLIDLLISLNPIPSRIFLPLINQDSLYDVFGEPKKHRCDAWQIYLKASAYFEFGHLKQQGRIIK